MKDHKTQEQLEAEADRLLQEAEGDIYDRTESDTISCKIGGKEKEVFKRICEQKLNCTMNEALQMLIDVICRYMDDRHNLSKELNDMIALFEGCNGWDAHVNLAEPISRKKIVAALYWLAQEDKPNGRIPALVDGPSGDLHQTITFNVQDIFEFIVQVFSPLRYERMKMIMRKLHADSMLATFDYVIDSFDPMTDMLEGLREGFEDCRRSEYGHEDLPDGPYKRTMNNSLSSAEERWFKEHQTTIEFPEDDEVINEIY